MQTTRHENMTAQSSQFSPFDKKAEGVQSLPAGPGNRNGEALKVEGMVPYWLPSQLELDKAIFQVGVSFKDNIKTLYISVQS